MPDLYREAVHAFWDSYDRRTLYRIIIALEQVETWALDEQPEVEAALIHLGEVLDLDHPFELAEEATFIRVLAKTKAGRALRILQTLDIKKPGAASQLLVYAEEAKSGKREADGHAELFLNRNLVFERLQLLSRVFAPYRLSLVLKALESTI